MASDMRHDADGGAHFFQGASNLNIHGPVIAMANLQNDRFENLQFLYAEVSSNAILNAGGRVDPVRCHPGTREEVISKAESWMASGYRKDRRILWLNGPAGAGKSAIMQTLAENCIERKVAMANFFFFRSDTSRNLSRPVVATLVYQLFEFFPEIKSIMNDIIGQQRLIFHRAIREQFMTLLDGPIRSIRHGSSSHGLPIVLLIDGIDECDSRAQLDLATKSDQTFLLQILHDLVTPPDSPFIAIVASRIEPHLEMAFNRVGRSRSSIHLNDDYSPDKDIRQYITSELSKVNDVHPLGRSLDAEWPTQSTVDAIVEKSSGQFIYAATILRFVANSPQSPSFTMQMVLGVRPVHEHSPFAEIDAIYSLILSRAAHWDSVRDVLAVKAICDQRGTTPKCPFGFAGKFLDGGMPLTALGYSEYEIKSFFADLTSIMQVVVTFGRVNITFYHASFPDFVFDTRRAGSFYIDLIASANHFAPTPLLRIQNTDTFILATAVLQQVDERSDALTSALLREPNYTAPNGEMLMGFLERVIFAKVHELYADHDKKLHLKLHDKWCNWFNPGHPGTLNAPQLPHKTKQLPPTYPSMQDTPELLHQTDQLPTTGWLDIKKILCCFSS